MPAIVSQTYQMVPVGSLEPHPANPHRGDVDVIAESIEKNGFFGTVLVQQSRMRIIAGEHRWRGAQAQGLAEVPALVIDVDDDTATRIMLADNRTAEYGEYDEQVLSDLLRGLPDVTGTGWSEDDLAELLDGLDDGIDVVSDSPAERRPAPTPRRPEPAADEGDGDGDDQDDDFPDDDEEEGDEGDAPPPRPRSFNADLLIPLSADEHAEVNDLLTRIRARDGDATTAQIIVAALRAHAA